MVRMSSQFKALLINLNNMMFCSYCFSHLIVGKSIVPLLESAVWGGSADKSTLAVDDGLDLFAEVTWGRSSEK